MKAYPYSRSRLLKDVSKLSFDYVPERLVHRERQIERLWTLFRPVLEGGVSQTALLLGSVGTGKTALSKRFCMDFTDAYRRETGPIDFLVVNCRQRPSENAVLLRIVNHFDPGFPDRGFSSAEMLRTIRGHLTKRRMHLIVVLDEVDVLLRRGAGDLIYSLSRFDEEKVEGRGSISLILISQKYVLDMLDPASLSTFRRANTIRFDRYSMRELQDIVAQRVDLAFYPGTVREDSVDLIADIASEFGDARFAIELLEKAGMLAEEEGAAQVEPEHVRGAKALTYSIVTESKIADLEKQHQLVLLSIARSLKERAYVTTGEVEKVYRIVAEEYGERPRGHTQFWTYLKELTDYGLIETKVGGESSGGRTTCISLPDIPAKVLQKKLEEMIG